MVVKIILFGSYLSYIQHNMWSGIWCYFICKIYNSLVSCIQQTTGTFIHYHTVRKVFNHVIRYIIIK